MGDVMPGVSEAATAFLTSLHARAAQTPRTILFPEATDIRTVQAVIALQARRSIVPVLVRRSDAPTGVMPASGVVLDPLTDPRHERIVAHLLLRRGDKGLVRDDAERLARDPLYFANSLVALGEADGCVAGAVHTTADVLRAAIWTIGAASGVRNVSSSFYLIVPAFRGSTGEVLTYTDCAVIPDPSARQLADIALAAAADRRRIVGDEPRVAFLSYSTMGSADGPSVSKVREAVTLVRQAAPSLVVSGELQADAALIADIARKRRPVRPRAVWPMFSSFRHSMPATSRTSSPSASPAELPSGPSCRAWPGPAVTCREGRRPTTLSMWRRSQRFRLASSARDGSLAGSARSVLLCLDGPSPDLPSRISLGFLSLVSAR